jgi:hypothetical protein
MARYGSAVLPIPITAFDIHLRTGFDVAPLRVDHWPARHLSRGQDLRRSVAAMLNGEPQLDDGGATPSYLAVSCRDERQRGRGRIAAIPTARAFIRQLKRWALSLNQR